MKKNKYYIGQPLLRTDPYIFGIIVEIDRKYHIAPFLVEWYYTLQTTYNHDRLIQRSRHTVKRVNKYIDCYKKYKEKSL